jgi:hypothetical protein
LKVAVQKFDDVKKAMFIGPLQLGIDGPDYHWHLGTSWAMGQGVGRVQCFR